MRMGWLMTPSEKKKFKELISFMESTKATLARYHRYMCESGDEINRCHDRLNNIDKNWFHLESDFKRLQDQIDASQLLKDVDK